MGESKVTVMCHEDVAIGNLAWIVPLAPSSHVLSQSTILEQESPKTAPNSNDAVNSKEKYQKVLLNDPEKSDGITCNKILKYTAIKI